MTTEYSPDPQRSDSGFTITGWAGPTLAPVPGRRAARRGQSRPRRKRGLPARHRSRGGFRGGGYLLLMAMLAALAPAALAAAASLAGSLGGGGGTGALRIGPPTQSPQAAGRSGAPSGPLTPPPPGMVPVHNVTLQLSPVPGTAVSATTGSSAPPAAAVTPAHPAPGGTASPAVAVRYTVGSRLGRGFQGEVDIANHGSAPISGWQLVIALPGDEITSFRNAAGYVSNHILLLRPSSAWPSIAPGASLRVSFTAEGQRTRPELCAFNDIACG